MSNTIKAGLLGIGVWSVGVPVASAQSLTYELQGLLESHPQIRAKIKGVSSAEEGVDAARAGYLPTVKLSGDSGPEYVDSPSRRLTEGRRFYKGRETSGLTVTQRLFDGGLTDSGVDASKVVKAISEVDLVQTRQSTLLEGTLAYVDVLRQSRLVQLARDNERKIQEQLHLEDERVQKGAGMASDVLAAKQRLQTAKERRVNYEGNFLTAVAKYNQVFGHGPDVAKFSDPPVPADLIPPQLEEALKNAEQDNPRIQTAAHTVSQNDEKRNIAEAAYYPTIDLIGKADYENDKNATIGVRRDWSLLLTANWEIFSGFKTKALVAQASYDHGAAKDKYLHETRKVSEDVKIFWHKLSTDRQRISLLDNAAALAEEVWAAQRKRREAGKATVQDVLDEETRVNDSRINYTGAYYDMIQHSYELLASMGRLELANITRGAPAPKSAALVPVTPQVTPTLPPVSASPALALQPVVPVVASDPSPVNILLPPRPASIPAATLDDLPDGSPSALPVPN